MKYMIAVLVLLLGGCKYFKGADRLTGGYLEDSVNATIDATREAGCIASREPLPESCK